jgi:DNA invertase Pin-like site-specific DNA recombinase
MKKYVAYYRVSTAKQGQSGLGLEAQRAAVVAFVKDAAGIIQEFVEVESGKRNDRPQLAAAIDYAKKKGATLIIAKLDRLSRNAGFIFALRDSGVDFVCADMPDANTLTVGIFAVLAQHERELISSRTKAALQAKIKQGHMLGTPANLSDAARSKGQAVVRQKAAANENNRRAAALVAVYRGQGMGWSAIAEALNKAGFRTSMGKQFQAVQVQRIHQRSQA